MDSAFIRASYPPKYYCLGCELLPLTFGHWFLLNDLCPAFTDHEVRGHGANLPLAVFICSRPYREAERSIRKWWAPLIFKVWGFRVRRYTAQIEASLFRAYLSDNQTGPVISLPQNAKRRECGGPWVWRYYSQLLATFHMTEAEAKETPILHALCLDAVHNEHHGHISLMHSNIRILRDRLRARTENNGAA